MKNPNASSLLLPLIGLILPAPTLGWGKDGHELVGNLAYRMLSDKTKAMVDKILVDHPFRTSTSTSTNTPLGDVADWADRVRIHSDYHWSGALHYIDIHDNDVTGGCPVYHQTEEQRSACRFRYERDCENDVCVAGAIVNYTHHLAGFSSSSTKTIGNRRLRGSSALLSPYKQIWPTTALETDNLVQESLMFLTHFVGDIHQPLHCARTTDKGGNSIAVSFTVPGGLEQEKRNTLRKSHHHQELHAVWDSSIILRAIHTEYDHDRDSLEEDLLDYIHKSKASGETKEWLACADTTNKSCTSAWAEESWQNALKWAYNNVDGQSEVISGTHLTDEYYQTRWPQIQHFLAVAGVRLAAALELAFQGNNDKDEEQLLLLTE